MKIRIFALLAGLAAFSAIQAQEFRGAIRGSVTDVSQAAVAGAKVTVTESSTNTRMEAVSDTSGHYDVPFLLPGNYDVTIQMTGFKEFVRRGIHLGAGEIPTVDARLQVGDMATTVEVVEASPLINSENASIGQAITTKEVEDLPTNGGTPLMLLTYAMGVSPMAQPSQINPTTSSGAASWSIAGGPNQTNEILLDGVPDTTWDGRLAYSPPQDAVAEVRVKAFDSDASYGHTDGGTANQILKSGANQLRGTASWKNQPNNLVANDFFRNKTGIPVQMAHFNQAGITAGGPVYLPKILDGRNRVFWFFAFDDLQNATPASAFMSVPTAAEKSGDFSQLLTTKTPSVIYNPYSATSVSGTVVRTAFPGNRIPASLISPVAAKYTTLLPTPNVLNSTRDDGYNNFGSSAISKGSYTNELGRLDFNVNPKNRTYFNVRHTDFYSPSNNYFNNIATGSSLVRNNVGATLDHVYIVNAGNVVDIRVNFTRMYEGHSSPSVGANPVDWGMPAYLASNSQLLALPSMSFASATDGATLGYGSNANQLPSQSLQVFGTWVAIRGKHNLKFGGEARQHRFAYNAPGNSTGLFSFGSNTWVRASSSASSTVTMGQDVSEFLLGLPTSGQYDINASAMYYAYYGALFVHDDWRVRRNVTLNLGLRFDHDFPWNEKWGRTVNGFAFNTPSPLANAAEAAYANSPSTLLDPSLFKVMGGLTFASPQETAIYKNTSHLFSPRVGVVWAPERFHNRLAVRAGFGVFVGPMTIADLRINGTYNTNPLSLQPGYSQTTQMTVTNDNYVTPAATLSDPFPGGAIQHPVGSANGLLSFAGQNISFMNPEMKSPYAVRWNFGIQYQFTHNMVLEAAYIGNHSVHLPVTYTQLNGIPRRFLSTLPTRDQSVITTLGVSTKNPFYGLGTATSTSTSISAVQILARYPQYPEAFNLGSGGVVMDDNNVGSSEFNSLSTRVQRRLSSALSIQGTFMWSKTIDRTTWLNDSDPAPERRISPFFRPMRFSTAITYALPIGRGKTINLTSHWLNTVAGGWQVTASYQYQTGGPLEWVNGSSASPGDYVYFGGKLKSKPRNVDGYAFDVTRFDIKSADSFQYHIRTFSTAFADVLSDGINEGSASALKSFRIDEKRYVQLRAEVFNVLNHPAFGAANNTATNTAFGTISSQANRSRMMQFVLRFAF